MDIKKRGVKMTELERLKKEMRSYTDDCIASRVGSLIGILKVKEQFKESLTQAEIIEILESVFD